MADGQSTTKTKLTSAERSERAKEAWRKRKAREEAAAKAARTPQEAQINPAGGVEGEKLHVEPEADSKGEVRTINFVTDGFTALGQVWYRGQDLSITVGSAEYNATVDREGKSWLDMDESTQIDRYGVVFFKSGAWQGRKDMTEDEYLAALSSDDAEALKRYEKQRQRQSGPPNAKVAKA